MMGGQRMQDVDSKIMKNAFSLKICSMTAKDGAHLYFDNMEVLFANIFHSKFANEY